MNIQRIAAFSADGEGGNPAGVVLLQEPLPQAEMESIAAEVGYSETAFAVETGPSAWRVRYFSPESEVPFCGHATIALGAALGERDGEGSFQLQLNDAEISVSANRHSDGRFSATLSSPETHSRPLTASELDETLELFGLEPDDLDSRLPPAWIHGGAGHIVLVLKDRATLSAMSYSLDEGRQLMRRYGVVTTMLVFLEADGSFAVRNAFASGGVLEDPATGAAAAAFAGYLRDRDFPHQGRLLIHQGVYMGSPSRILVELTDVAGSTVKVSGATHPIDE